MTEGEGDIVLRETCGSSGREILYVRPPNQKSVVAVQRGGGGGRGAVRWLTAVFLPHGYPDSVSPDYTHYQLWDTAQAFCSTITGTLATQEVLRGVGVGDAGASPAAATITWVFKEACGHFGRIIFAASHGMYLDAYSKKWRLYADCLNDAAICLEMSLPLFRGYEAALLCLTTAMKAVVGVAGGATRAALTQHHAVASNMADVAAKDSAQETAVNLLASMLALLIVTALGPSLVIFGVMVVLHVLCNYLAVSAVCLRTFNAPRLLHCLHHYLRCGDVVAPPAANRAEPLFWPGGSDVDLCGFEIELGASAGSAAAAEAAAKAAGGGARYAVWPERCGRGRYRTRVLLARSASAEDVLRAYLHAVLLSCLLSCTQGRPPAVCGAGRMAAAARCAEAGAVHRLAEVLAAAEWARVRPALLQAGWNLDKHLLITDEWRYDEHSGGKGS